MEIASWMTSIMDMLKKLATGFTAGISLVALAVPANAAALAEPPKPHKMGIDPLSLDDPAAIRAVYGPADKSTQKAARAAADDPTADARCGNPAADPVPDGEPIVVTMAPAAPFTVGKIPASMWRNPPVTDPTWRLNFEGLMWMKPLARRAAQDGQTESLNALIQQAIAFHTQSPDPQTNDYGWDEGTALRRLETLNCLFALAKPPVTLLMSSMTANVNVLFGWRYYGPPNYPVHNHGLMANLQLIRASELVGNRPTWAQKGVDRIVDEAPESFSKMGISFEQSSAYQGGNAVLWEQAAVALEARGDNPAAATAIRKTVNDALRAYSFMTEPDGIIPQIGDSDEVAGRPLDLKANRGLLDTDAGWAIGRFKSWTDPTVPHYTVRFGPPRRAHGHEDRAGGLTWSNQGVRILVGPGRYSYDKTDMYSQYQTRADGQNVAIPNGGTVQGGTSTIASSYSETSHVFTVTDTVYGTPHTRGVTVNSDVPRLVVSDAFSAQSKWRQQWHLDPEWVKSSGNVGENKVVYRHPTSGKFLTVTTTGTVVSLLRGSNDPRGPYGWHFPKFQVREPAWQMMIDNVSNRTVTTFWIADAPV
ncbi:hypothetical protein AB0M54_39400 [Actinoplanes sp. NPDC051470]|uniref:hypothetical protein n=1 Tax=unclassified Actinoplanes TaxID=2626549 RepID=UPI00343C736E